MQSPLCVVDSQEGLPSSCASLAPEAGSLMTAEAGQNLMPDGTGRTPEQGGVPYGAGRTPEQGGGCRLTQQLRIRGLGGGEGSQQRRQAVQLRLRLQPPQRNCARAPPASPLRARNDQTACPMPSVARQTGACPFHCLRVLQRLAPLKEAQNMLASKWHDRRAENVGPLCRTRARWCTEVLLQEDGRSCRVLVGRSRAANVSTFCNGRAQTLMGLL